MAISNLYHLIKTSNPKMIFFASIVLIYFAWMDIALYINLQRWTPPLSQYEANNVEMVVLFQSTVDSSFGGGDRLLRPTYL